MADTILTVSNKKFKKLSYTIAKLPYSLSNSIDKLVIKRKRG